MDYPYWWRRSDLYYHQGDLFLGDENLNKFTQSIDTPCFVYNSSRVTENIHRLHHALNEQIQRYQIFYAMKANRNLPLLSHIRNLRLTGIDCCSPNEVLLARQIGFRPSEISFTGIALSNSDLNFLLRYTDMWINCDSLSQIRRIGELAPGRKIGIRINPASGIGYTDDFQYSGEKTTKFGIYADAFLDALKLVKDYGLVLAGIHCHLGWGMLTRHLSMLDSALDQISWFIQQSQVEQQIQYVNLGGGLGIPHRSDDGTIDLFQWAELIALRLHSYGVDVFVEPGDYIVKDAGVFLVQITAIEQKRDRLFVFVNGGSNLVGEPTFYGIPHEIVPVYLPNTSAEMVKVSVVGNINEAIDVLAEDVYLHGSIQEGDYLAILNTGGYNASMSSNHCMRGTFQEYLI